jgi:hypothetical protein
MSSAIGKAFDAAEIPFKDRALKKGVKEIVLEPSELAKMKESTLPLRAEWVKDMEAKGFPAQQILDTALGFIEKK